MSRRTQTWAATLLFAALTVLMTWPQAKVIVTHAHAHYDVYFNMWRLAWIAHALSTSPSRLFDGNIFYPEPRALTYSDALLVEGVLAAPLLLMGLPRVLVHNLVLLGAIVSSAAGIFVLARHVTGSAWAALVSGVIFSFVPYRYDHYMHMELQWTTWMPWAFWSLHRTLETHSWRFGALTGLFLSLQMMSSIYYGVFLALLLGVATAILLVGKSATMMVRSVKALAPAAVVAGLLCGAYAQPYLATKEQVGGRAEGEIMTYSARPSSYLVATPDNILYGKAFESRGRQERRLFPGLLAVVLGMIGALACASSRVVVAYLLVLVTAFEISLGFSGYIFPFLHKHVAVFHGFRAIARVGIFVALFLAILAGYGFAAMIHGRRSSIKGTATALLVAGLLLEYRVRPLNLVPYPNEAPVLQAWLAQQPRGVVAELPMPKPDGLPGWDPRAGFLSTFHWFPIVNGYSGFVPKSYLQRLDDVRRFPDDRAMDRLRRDNVRYLVIHMAEYPRDEGILLLQVLKERHHLRELVRLPADVGYTVVFFLQ